MTTGLARKLFTVKEYDHLIETGFLRTPIGWN